MSLHCQLSLAFQKWPIREINRLRLTLSDETYFLLSPDPGWLPPLSLHGLENQRRTFGESAATFHCGMLCLQLPFSCLIHGSLSSVSAAYHFRQPYFLSDHETCALSDLPEIYLHAAVKEMEPLISSYILELLKLYPWQSQLGDSQCQLGFLFHFVLFWLFF